MFQFDKSSLNLTKSQLRDLLLQNIKYLPQSDQEFIELAFELMCERHAQQRRKSGDFYIIHPVLACLSLTKIQLEKETLAACLLHDVPEDTFKNPAEGINLIEKEFGKEVSFLVYGVTKLSMIKYKGEERFAENLRKLFVSMSKDIRVIFIKLADRIHNLRTLNFVHESRPDKAKRIALESLEIYAPIAERLGISSFRTQIEDLAFPYAFPEEYQNFIKNNDIKLEERQKKVKTLVEITKKALDKNKINYSEVLGRAKRYYSIYRKMNDFDKDLSEIYDLLALRIITNSISDCYQILSVLHQEFDYSEKRIKDYIKEPKENGYKSIHTTVCQPNKADKFFELQIRTKKMHNFAEYGVASHWSYKQKKKSSETEIKTKDFKWIKEIVEIGDNDLSASEYLKQVKLKVYQNRIFVLTPKGDAIDLPRGATPLDFAFKIHLEVGEHAFLAKVNGQATKLNSKLKSGDVVEIITDKKRGPTTDWLSWVQSTSAAKTIRKILRDNKNRL